VSNDKLYQLYVKNLIALFVIMKIEDEVNLQIIEYILKTNNLDSFVVHTYLFLSSKLLI